MSLTRPQATKLNTDTRKEIQPKVHQNKIEIVFFEGYESFYQSILFGYLLTALRNPLIFKERTQKLFDYLLGDEFSQLNECLNQYNGKRDSLLMYKDMLGNLCNRITYKMRKSLSPSPFIFSPRPEDISKKYILIYKKELEGDDAELVGTDLENSALLAKRFSDRFFLIQKIDNVSIALLQDMLNVQIVIHRLIPEGKYIATKPVVNESATDTIELVYRYRNGNQLYDFFSLLIDHLKIPMFVSETDPLIEDDEKINSPSIQPELIDYTSLPEIKAPTDRSLIPIWNEIKKMLSNKTTELKLYIALQASIELGVSSSKADDFIDLFLKNTAKQVLLIQGTSASGKTLLMYRLFLRLWNEKINDTSQPIPLFLPAFRFDDTENKVLETFVINDIGIQDVETFKENEIILLLDGLDELDKKERTTSLLNRDSLKRWKIKKCIISGRTDVISQYKTLLTTKELGETSEMSLKPFTEKQITDYLIKYVRLINSENLLIEDFDYESQIKNIPGLLDLITSPYILSIVTQILPTIITKYRNQSEIKKRHLTRIEIYDTFTDFYFQRQVTKLRDAQRVDEEIPDDEIKEWFSQYSTEFALAIVHNKKTGEKILFPSDLKSTIANLDVDFSPLFVGESSVENERLEMIRSGCLIDFIPPNIYQFKHSSLLDYYAAYDIFSGISSEASTAIGYELNSPELLSSPEKIHFIIDKIRHDENLEQLLWDLILQTRVDKRIEVAGANAATLLNKSKVSFARRDLRRIRIPFAILDHNNSDYTNYSEADLRGVRFEGSWLYNAVFTQACLDGAYIGEYPFLRRIGKDNKAMAIVSIALSPDQSWLAVGYGYDGHIDLYYTIMNFSYIKTFEISQSWGSTRTWIKCLIFLSSDLLVAAYSNNKIKIWQISTGRIYRKIKFKTFIDNLERLSDSHGLLVMGHNGELIQFDLNGNFSKSVIPLEKIENFTINPQKNEIAILQSFGHFSLWSITGSSIRKFNRRSIQSASITISFDGQYIVLGGLGLELWKRDQSDVIFCTDILKDTLHIENVKFNSDNFLLATAMDDHSIRLWTIEDEQLILISVFKGHQGSINNLLFLTDRFISVLISSGLDDFTVQLRDILAITANHQKNEHMNGITCMSYSPSTNEILSVSDNSIYRRSFDTWEINGVLSDDNILHIRFLVISHQYNCVIFSTLSDVCCYDLITNKQLYKFQVQDKFLTNPTVSALTINPNGDVFAVAIEKIHARIKIFQVIDGHIITTSALYTLPCTSLQFNPNNLTQLVSSHKSVDAATTFSIGGRQWMSSDRLIPNMITSNDILDSRIVIWETLKNPRPLSFTEKSEGAYSIVFRPYHNNQFGFSTDNSIFFYSLDDESSTFQISTKNSIRRLTFNESGALLAGANEIEIIIWNVDLKESIFSFHVFHDTVTSILFSPVGNNLVAASRDNTIKFFEMTQLDSKRINATLKWASHYHFECQGINISGVTGCSTLNTELFYQRGAKGNLSSKSSEDIIRVREASLAVQPSCSRHAIFDSSIVLKPNLWAVSLVRKKGIEHAFMLMESIEDGFYRFRRGDFFLSRTKPSYFFKFIGTGHIEFIEISPYELDNLANETKMISGKPVSCYEGRAYAISATQGNRLIKNILEDFEKTLRYVISGKKGINCITWVEGHLKTIDPDIKLTTSWYDIFAHIPSQHIPS